MYNVILDKTAYQTGREFLRTAVASQKPTTPFPAATADILAVFVSQSEASWVEYSQHRKENYQHSIIFSQALRAVTALTLAAELASDMHWVMRMSYHPLEKDRQTEEQRRFAREAERLLRLMRKVVSNLCQMKGGDDSTSTSPAEQIANLHERLTYALHVADLAVTLAQPAFYQFHHPDTSKVLALRAATRRNIAASFIALAKADEAALELVS